MSIQRTKHGTWEVRWRDVDGRNRSRTLKTQALAERFERTVRTDTDRGLPTGRPKTMTVRAFADQWLAGAHNLREGGRSLYRRDLDRHILPALGDTPLHRLTPAAIDKFLADEADAGVAASSRHRHWRTLRAMLRVAEDRDLIARSPIRKVRPPRVPRTEMRFLDAPALERLADAAVLRDKKGKILADYRAMVLVAGWGGLRWSEIAGLLARYVTDGSVEVVAQLVDGHRWEEPKGGSRRTVPLPASVLDLVDVPDDPDGLVFTSPRGEPLNHSNWHRRVFAPAKKAAGVDGAFRFHDLRHTAVALAVAGGARASSIKARMGHSSIQVTLDTYGHLLPEVDEQVVAGLDKLRSEATGKRLRAV